MAAGPLLLRRGKHVFGTPLADTERGGLHVVEKSKLRQRGPHLLRILSIPEGEDAVVVEI